MDLRVMLSSVAAGYDSKAPTGSPIQDRLRSAKLELAHLVPAGYLVEGSGGRGVDATVPWIAVFDPDETTTATRGICVVYLFAADMSTVYLTVMQGVTYAREKWKGGGRDRFRRQAEAIRAKIEPALSAGLSPTVDLRHSGRLPKDYEAGIILARAYGVDALPSEHELRADLARFVRLSAVAIEVRNQLGASTPEIVAATSPEPVERDSQGEFKPKNDSEYVQEITGRKIVKTRKHETLVKHYGTFLSDQGFRPNTKVHPRDLVATKGDDHWLIEAKIVPNGNGVQAARDAMGQLLMCRRFHYPDPESVRTLALFNESVGDLCVT
ncbi:MULTISPECIES: MrcB family domain-containing protein [Amycolatopsis]|uniref:Type IV methyl-directed restriction enzyme EcoKMcrB subunit DNA-binding domain-containing protein n=1 Tax=Amycolatopsis dongchuanensis TaxID=1070866 RepID=A0ABP9PYZ9_9PSEU